MKTADAPRMSTTPAGSTEKDELLYKGGGENKPRDKIVPKTL